MIKVHFIDRDKIADQNQMIGIMMGVDLENKVRAAWDAGAYTHVATFPGLDGEAGLDHAWHHTNNGNGQTDSWSLDPSLYPIEIVAPFPTHKGEVLGHRSSMVGDVYELTNSDRYVVASFGFEKL